MPIGILRAELRKKEQKPQMPKPEKVKKPAPPVKPAPIPVAKPIEPVKTEPPKPPVKPKPTVAPPQPVIGEYHGSKGDPMKVVFLCRSQQQAVDYFCGMRINMTAAAGCGITLSVVQNTTLSVLAAAKSKLDYAFFNQEGRCNFGSSAGGTTQFLFSLSAAIQEIHRIALDILCGAPENFSEESLRMADAIWILLDGNILDKSYGAYESALQACIGKLGSINKPIYIMLSQTEKVGRYWGNGGCYSYPSGAMANLTDICKELFESCLSAPATILPVQIYGGMDYAGNDENGFPVLKMNNTGNYVPVACETPVLHTIAAICERRGINYFENTVPGGYLSAYRKHLVGNYDDKICRPSAIGGGADK